METAVRLSREVGIATALTVLGLSLRLLPHAANFAPVGALAIVSAVYLPRRLAWTVPLAIMALSDLWIGLHPLVAFTWGSYVLLGLLASFGYERLHRKSLMLGFAPVGSLLFFSITNFGVWLQGQLYTRNFAGLVRCYEMALPFLRNTGFSDLFYTGLFLGLATAISYLPTSAKAPMENHGTL